MLIARGSDKAPFKRGWEEAIALDPQLVAEQGKAWAHLLREALVEQLRYFEKNRLPQPAQEDFERFEALMPARITPKSVRNAGAPMQIEAWNPASTPDRRMQRDRRVATNVKTAYVVVPAPP